MQEQPDMVRSHVTTPNASLSRAATRSLPHDSLRRLHCIQRRMMTSLQVAEALAGLLKVALADQRVRPSGIFAPALHSTTFRSEETVKPVNIISHVDGVAPGC